MRIAILSDTHDNLPNFRKAIEWIKTQGIEFLIHCGDVCSPQTLDEALTGFLGDFLIVLGNADKGYLWQERLDQDKSFKNRVFEDFGEIKIDGKNIAFCHFPQGARNLAESQQYDLVFYGHTHKPWEGRIGKCRLVNPGNLASVYYKSTFAIYDTEADGLELKILESLE